MRFQILAVLLLAGAAIPAAAQDDRTDRRVERLEQEVRALQRRVFQGVATVQPEIGAATQAGVPASSALVDTAARLDALERQIAALTGQAEENANRLRLLQDALATVQPRLAALERTAAPEPAPVTILPTDASTGDALATPSTSARSTAATATPARAAPARVAPAVDPAETAYNAGFRLWEQKRYAEAQRALEAMAKAYPSHRLASWGRNLAGRAYLDEGKPATAAKAFLANYQADRNGERAADSLFFLGEALTRLNKRVEACKVYDELQEVYGAKLRDFLKSALPRSRSAAKCGG